VKVHVTGDLGFVGKHVYAHLVKLGFEVSGCDWPNDLRHVQELDVDAVVHLAAIGGVGRAQRNPRSVMSTNVDSTMALRAALRPTKEGHFPRVVQISSFSIYGGQSVPFHEGTEPRPREIYGASKLAQELCWSGYEGPLTILRLSSVYGAAMRLDEEETTVIAKIAKAARDGDVFNVYEDGLQDRDFVHVDDVAACVSAALRGVDYQLINVCSGERTSILETCELLGAKYRILNRPRSSGDMRSCWGLTDRVRALLGRAPKIFREHYRDIC
jgi:nucleoside-diphosphate-sugar epimerase